MKNRPLCLAAVILAACILMAQWLGISWIWRSPAGIEPEKHAAMEDSVKDSPAQKKSMKTGLVKAEGIVYRQEEKTDQRQSVTYLYLKQTNLYINSKKYPIRNIKCELKGVQIPVLGCRLCVQGILRFPESPGNPGEFDRRGYERARKIDFYLEDAQVLEQTEAGKAAVFLEKIRVKCRTILQEIFPQSEAGVLEAMLLGEKELLDEDIKYGFQAAGISHIIAISGLHITMLGIGVWNGLKWLGFPMTAASLASLVLLAGYGVLIGSPVTAARALIMFGLMLGAKLVGRTYDLLSALAAAAILLLLDNPDLLWNSGFQMSFAAVAGMGSYGEFQRNLWKMHRFPGGKRKKCQGKKGAWRKVGENLVTGCALWIFMLPIVLYAFFQVSIQGIIYNLLVLPLMPAVLGSGFLALLLGYWDIGIGSTAGIPAYGIVRGYEWLGEIAEYAKAGIWTPGKPSIGAVLIYYGILGVSCAVCGKIMKEKEICRSVKRRLAVIQISALLLALSVMAAPWKNHDGITVLDVGQGDGIVLQSGRVQALVDGGSTSKNKVGKYVILPYLKHEGISCLEGIFLTHSDQDHVNGAKEVLEEAAKGWLTVEKVFCPVWMKETQEGKEIFRLAQRCEAACVFLKAGDEMKMGDAVIRVLYPGEESYDDPNAGSLVFTWELGGVRALFTGDLPGEKEKELLDKVPVCTVLKAAHHGSGSSTSAEFLEKVKPEAAFISCGKNNRYGHPARETIERLTDSGSRIFRTDMQGALLVSRKKNNWYAEEFRKSMVK